MILGMSVVWIAALAGCQTGPRTTLLVDFPTDKPLRYTMSSSRTVEIRLAGDKPERDQSHTVNESLDLVMEYRAVESNPFGLSTIEGKCISAKVKRDSLRGTQGAKNPDVAEELTGKSFKFTISPAGRIEDFSELDKLVRDLGAKSFIEGSTAPTAVKDPDMLTDFIAMQWYLWDCAASVKNPSSGVQTDKPWKAIQLLPLPVPIPVARETTYQLTEMPAAESPKKAVIASTYAISDKEIPNWPTPYEGKFNLKGSLFAVMRNYRFNTLEGTGTAVLDLDKGILESDKQQWKVGITAEFLLPLGNSLPQISVNQKISIQRVTQ
jgi:hypothetical protein